MCFLHVVQKRMELIELSIFEKNRLSDNKKIGRTKKEVGERCLTRLTVRKELILQPRRLLEKKVVMNPGGQCRADLTGRVDVFACGGIFAIEALQVAYGIAYRFVVRA